MQTSTLAQRFVVAVDVLRDDVYSAKEWLMQTRGTYPETHVPKPKGKPKGGKCGK